MKRVTAFIITISFLIGLATVLPLSPVQATYGDVLTSEQIDAAIGWAKSKLGLTTVERNGRFTLSAGRHCGSFVWSAYYYGCEVDLYPSYYNAKAMREDMRNRGLLFADGSTPPKGAMVFFYTEPDGHVGISLGDGSYIHLGSYGVAVDVLSQKSNFAGWSRPFEYLLPSSTTTSDSNVSFPIEPVGLAITAKTINTVTVSWSPVSGASSYEVQYRTPTSGGWKTDPDYKNKTATSYISTGLNNEYKYEYRVRAINSAGVSEWVVDAYDKTPGLKNTIVQPTGISLDKSDYAITTRVCSNLIATVFPRNATNQNVAWKSSNPSVATVDSSGMIEPINNGTTVITATTVNGFSASCFITVDFEHIHKAVKCGLETIRYEKSDEKYHNTIRNDGGELCECGYVVVKAKETTKKEPHTFSGNTCAQCAYTKIIVEVPPGNPTGLNVAYLYHRDSTSPQSYAASVSWNAVPGASHYEVEYRTSVSNAWRAETDYTGSTATSYISGSNSGMVYGRTYYFRVRAVGPTGLCSDWAETSYVHQAPTAPAPEPDTGIGAPTGLTVEYLYHRSSTSPESYAASVSWNAVSGAAYYEVQYATSVNYTWKTETDYTDGTATSYISGANSGMVYGRTYYFRVRAISTSGIYSDWTEISYVQ